MSTESHRQRLRLIADRAMRERGLEPDFPPDLLAQVASLGPAVPSGEARDLRRLPWCSIDNDDSRDLDQLSVAEDLGDGRIRVLVAIADVDALVPGGCAADDHARRNTTSIYTAAAVFPMLPERLSTDLTSLNEGEDRLAVVVDLVVGPAGVVGPEAVYRAVVRNQARLAYHGVAAWLAGDAPPPAAMTGAAGLDAQLRLQDVAAQALDDHRRDQGALDFESLETRPVFDGDRLAGLARQRKNRATAIIENFMVAANGATARFLETRGVASIRRIVRSPKRWDRIVELAARLGDTLPDEPDGRALRRFLVEQRAADPARFPDLSLGVIKLLGAGEYAVERPGEDGPGHFGLAARDYAHSTAPNRRYPDLVTQRLLKAALAGTAVPYAPGELDALAALCTRKEDDANKVERTVGKAAAALLLEDRIGQRFDAMVTGASAKGTWVRILDPVVEGRLVAGVEEIDVGDRLRVRLVDVDPERGYIDFARAR